MSKYWLAVQTKYKCEKYVAKHLTAKGIECFLPLLSTTKHYATRKKTYHKPLINCYVFCRIDESQCVTVLRTEYVYGFLTLAGKKAVVQEEEIEILKRVVGEGTDASIVKDSFAVGSNVEIISGNLTGIRGVLLEEKGKNNFVVSLTSMGMELTMTVQKQHLAKVSHTLV